MWEHRGANGHASRSEIVSVLHGMARFFGGTRIAIGAMTEANGWRFVGPAKPAQVEPGQVWRCVGIEGDLEVRRRGDDDQADMGPVGWPEHGSIRASVRNMLGLREWTFVRGQR